MNIHFSYLILASWSALLLSGCSATKPAASALPIQSNDQNQIQVDAKSWIRFQLPNDQWQLQSINNTPNLVSPDGARIVFLRQNVADVRAEARSELITESFAEVNAGLGSDWMKAETEVISINKSLGDLPLPNMMWVANKAGKELAVLHFYKKGEVFTIRVEGTENIARENLTALITGAQLY